MKYIKFITRNMLTENPNTLFVFGDNMIRQGMGGQAREMRGEPNAVGIPTKRLPGMTEESFFTDKDFEDWLLETTKDFARLIQHDGDIVWPEDDIGTGLAELPQRSPKIWNFIQEIKKYLENKKAG